MCPPRSSTPPGLLRSGNTCPGRRRSSDPVSRSTIDLTDRERDVALLVARGLSNPEVAAQLYVSRKAVEYHLGNIYAKLGIHSRRELRRLQLSA